MANQESKQLVEATTPKLTFEQRYEETAFEIEKRRRGWRLTALSFDDVKQELLIHVSRRYHKFDPSKTINGEPVQYTHWLNKVVSAKLKNILRDNYLIYSRPCIQGCPFYVDDKTCTQTKSGLQCSECKLYADWEKRKLHHYNVAQTLPLENHSREVENVQSDFLDIAAAKEILDRRILEKLNDREQKMYTLLFIMGKSEKQVGAWMGYAKVGKMHPGYQPILTLRHKVKKLARQIVEEEGLV